MTLKVLDNCNNAKDVTSTMHHSYKFSFSSSSFSTSLWIFTKLFTHSNIYIWIWKLIEFKITIIMAKKFHLVRLVKRTYIIVYLERRKKRREGMMLGWCNLHPHPKLGLGSWSSFFLLANYFWTWYNQPFSESQSSYLSNSTSHVSHNQVQPQVVVKYQHMNVPRKFHDIYKLLELMSLLVHHIRRSSGAN